MDVKLSPGEHKCGRTLRGKEMKVEREVVNFSTRVVISPGEEGDEVK